MKEKQRQELVLSVQDFRLPKYDEIPDVGLFLEQTTKYIAKYVEPLQDVTITGSMISNYVKKKIIAKPVKKQYYTEQIAYLIFIAIAKSVLSLEDINLFIQLQKKTYDTKTAYEYFCSELQKAIPYVFGIGEYPEANKEDDTHEKIMLRNTVITIAHKVYLDKCFALLHEEKQHSVMLVEKSE